jgi:D-glycero-alpha-D-manno-heptose 1-phosphate guanylyltransferase
MKLLVLAGGFGTRLHSLFSEIPKPMAPIGNIPFLSMQIENWKKQGVKSMSFMLHHMSEQIIDFLISQRLHSLNGLEVDWLVEPIPMGTGGAIANAVHQLNIEGDFLVINADTWLGDGILSVYEESAPAIGVKKVRVISRFGHVLIDPDGFVSSLSEKNNIEVEDGWINAGLVKVSSKEFDSWNGSPFSLERVTLPALANAGRLKAVKLKGDFIDIGIPEDYYRFCNWIRRDCSGAL